MTSSRYPLVIAASRRSCHTSFLVLFPYLQAQYSIASFDQMRWVSCRWGKLVNHSPLTVHYFSSIYIYTCAGLIAVSVFYLVWIYIACFLALSGSGLLLIYTSVYITTVNTTMWLVSTSVGLWGMVSSGHLPYLIDITPTSNVGSLYGIINTISVCSGFISPAVTAMLLGKSTEEGPGNWNHVFLLNCALSVTSSLLFIIFATKRRLEIPRKSY